jgi:SnoaL-like protein
MGDVTEITQLVLRERQGRDRGWWEQMRSCFTEDSTVRLSWFRGSGPDFVTASEKMVARGDAALHRLSPPVVNQVGDRAIVELSAVIEIRTVIDDIEVDLSSSARLNYRVRRHNGDWLVAALDPVYEHDTLLAAHPGVQLSITPADVAAFRPSYRFLAYTFGKRGYPVGDDLYGDDRPEAAAAFYRDARAWLTASAP